MAELTLVNQRAGAKRQRTDPVVVRRIKGPSGCMLEKKRGAVVQSGNKPWEVGGIAGEFHNMPACRGSGYDAKRLLRGVAPRDPWVHHAQPCYSRPEFYPHPCSWTCQTPIRHTPDANPHETLRRIDLCVRLHVLLLCMHLARPSPTPPTSPPLRPAVHRFQMA